MSAKKSLLMTHRQFLSAVPEELRQNAELLYAQESFARMVVTAAYFFLVGVFSLTRDLLTGFYHRPDEPLNLLNGIGLTILVVSSAIILLLRFSGLSRGFPLRSHQKVTLFYYLAVDATLALLLCNEFYRSYYVNYEEFYWIFFAVIPLLHLRYCFANLAVTSLVYTAEFFLVGLPRGGNLLDFLYILPLLYAFSIFGFYLRRYYLQNIIYRMRNEALTNELQRRSRFDPLTHCFNRYVLEERFDDWRRAGRDLTVLMFDIDFFKSYNDGFSHLKGDDCLIAITKAVADCCRGRTADLFRYGGEEFVILAADLDETKSCHLAYKILQRVRDLAIPMPATGENTGPIVTVSIGISRLPADQPISLSDAVGLADTQLYRAKAAGRNCIYFDSHRID